MLSLIAYCKLKNKDITKRSEIYLQDVINRDCAKFLKILSDPGGISKKLQKL